jgi:hypothetical protein
MEEINYTSARALLKKACERYVAHNEAQLHKLQGKTVFFHEYGWHEPQTSPPGFGNWLSIYAFNYLYERICRTDLHSWETVWMDSKSLNEQSYYKEFGFVKFKLYNIGREMIGREEGSYLNANVFDPSIVLNNLKAMAGTLNYTMLQLFLDNNEPDFQIKFQEYRERNKSLYPFSWDSGLGYTLSLKSEDTLIEANTLYIEAHDQVLHYTVLARDGEIKTGTISFDELFQARTVSFLGYESVSWLIDPSMQEDRYWARPLFTLDELYPLLPKILEIASKRVHILPISQQLQASLEHLKSLIDFIAGLPRYQSSSDIQRVHDVFYDTYPVFEGYIKGIAVKELKEILDAPHLSDEESLQQVELQLKSKGTTAILMKNRQSQSEQILKVLSVVSILVGIGVFTTLGLAFKRYYDSGGHSFNFFKPLSSDLYEEAENVTAHVKKML